MSYASHVRAAIGRLYAVLTNHTVSDSAAGSPASAQFGCTDAGAATFATLNSGSGSYPGEYGLATGSLYEVRWTITSGAITSGSATGTWLSLSVTRAWAVSTVAPGTASCIATVEIRSAASQVVLASATITISATTF